MNELGVKKDGKGSRMEKDQGVLSDSPRCWLPRKQKCLQMLTVFTAMQQLPVPRIGMKWYLRLRRKE